MLRLKIVQHFSTFTTKINGNIVDKENHIYIAMPRYNLIEYSANYSDTSGSLWQFKSHKILIILNHLNRNQFF